jgi:hypothetical protein
MSAMRPTSQVGGSFYAQAKEVARIKSIQKGRTQYSLLTFARPPLKGPSFTQMPL